MPTSSFVIPPTAPLLLVDDSPANLLALEAVLAPLGQALVKASSGEEGLWHTLRQDFAAILLDVELGGGMDGFETARLLKQRARTRYIPILFLTATSADEAHIFRAYREGAVDYLVKPLNEDVLRAKVAFFVELHLARETVHRQEVLLRQQETARIRQEGEVRLERTLSAAEVAAWQWLPQEDTLAWSSHGRALLGGEPQSLQALLGHVPAEEAPRVRQCLEQAAAGQEECRVEFRFDAPGLPMRWLACRGRRLSEEAHCVAGVLLDITDRRRAEEERDALLTQEQETRQALEAQRHRLERLTEELRQAVRQRDEFLSVASHELKTPLTPLSLRLTRLRQEAEGSPEGCLSSARVVSVVDLASRNLKRLVDLVNGLLDVSRLSTAGLTLQRERVDLATLVREVADVFQPEAERAGCSLQVHASQAVVGQWDRFRMEQVLTNLLSNALKYGAGHPIHLQVEGDGEVARLTVRDEGIGIAPEVLPRIFQKFERGVSERHYGGLGLGLYIAHEVVKAQGGRIRAESRPGNGATFTVELPRSGAAASPP